MFALIESGPAPRRRGEWTSRWLSLAIHAALITAAVMATKQVAHVTEPPLVELPDLPWPKAPRPERPPCVTCYLPGRPFPTTLPVPVPDPTMTDPPTIPTTFVPGVPTDPGASAANPFPTGSRVVPDGPPFEPRAVDEPPEMLSHPEPRYPEILRLAGIEGSVVIEAVLDTTGRAERGSLRIVSAAHPLFEAEAQQVVIGSRYRPARMAGRPVRVRVRIPIRFGIRR